MEFLTAHFNKPVEGRFIAAHPTQVRSQFLFVLVRGDDDRQAVVIAPVNDLEECALNEFRVRGDTIDIFPAEHNELAVRVELLADPKLYFRQIQYRSTKQYHRTHQARYFLSMPLNLLL